MTGRNRSTRSWLYALARVVGNVQAAEKGPTAYGKRRVRRVAYRSVNRSLGRVLRGMGLG